MTLPKSPTGLKTKHNHVKPIRVLIADDHALVRAGFRALLEKIEGVVVVGEAGKGSEALILVEELKPSLMLLDIAMPEGSGFSVLRYVKKNFPDMRVIMLTVHEAVEYAQQALSEGAAGFIAKSAASTELGQAIQTVMRGEVYLSPEMSIRTVREHGRPTKKALLGSLSPRQIEVLRLTAKGVNNKQIADRLGITVKTVETHKAKLMKKLDIHNDAGLTRFAIMVGLINADDDDDARNSTQG